METDGRRNSSLLIIEENGQPSGFVYATHGALLTTVIQIAVAQDARRLDKGRTLVEAVRNISRHKGKLGLRCRVAQDLDANGFWTPIGFQPIGESAGTFLGKPSGPKARPLHVYERLIAPRFLPDTRAREGPTSGKQGSPLWRPGAAPPFRTSGAAPSPAATKPVGPGSTE